MCDFAQSDALRPDKVYHYRKIDTIPLILFSEAFYQQIALARDGLSGCAGRKRCR
jgi:hypothetical protein